MIRARHVDHKPVIVHVPDRDLNEEHQLYLKVGESAGFFWPISEATAEKDLFTVEITSLEDFKSAAKAARTWAKLRLPAPDHVSRPAPVHVTR